MDEEKITQKNWSTDLIVRGKILLRESKSELYGFILKKKTELCREDGGLLDQRMELDLTACNSGAFSPKIPGAYVDQK